MWRRDGVLAVSMAQEGVLRSKIWPVLSIISLLCGGEAWNEDTLDVLRCKMTPCVQCRPWCIVLTVVYSVVVWQWVDVMLFFICMVWQSLLLMCLTGMKVQELYISPFLGGQQTYQNNFFWIYVKFFKFYFSAFLFLFTEHKTKKCK